MMNICNVFEYLYMYLYIYFEIYFFFLDFRNVCIFEFNIIFRMRVFIIEEYNFFYVVSVYWLFLFLGV